MSISRDFQVRHGLAVSGNLLVANTQTNNIGIGTNNPAHKLDISGSVNATSFLVSGQSVTGTIAAANAIAIGAFASANAGQSTANASFARANTANITADLAYTRANTANITADRAWNHANASFDLANTAYAMAALQQDPSAVTAAALHRSPNAITAMTIYDTSKDSDGGAWTEKCQHTSWYNEPLSGKWLGAQDSELAARAFGGTLGRELISNGTFDTGITGWISGGADLVLSSVDGRLRATASGVTSRANSPTVTTVVGKLYRVSFNFYGGTQNTARVLVRAGATMGGGTTVYDGVLNFPSTNAFVGYFYAADTTYRFEIFTPASGTYFEFDNFSIREVTALNTTSNDYFQLTTDGKFYKFNKNLLSNTDDFKSAYWGALSSVTANQGTGPSGAMTADLLASGRIECQTMLFTVPGVYTLSIYVKGTAGQTIGLGYFQTGLMGNVNVELFTLNGNLQRITRTITITSLGSVGGDRFVISANGDQSATATNVLLASAQLEFGSTATTYEPKTTDGSISEVFRGNKADFPRLAAIVAEASNVNIYDLTEPGRPMWMRFVSNGHSYCPNPVASVHALNGLMGFAGNATSNAYINAGFRVVDFMKDRALKYHSLAGGNEGLSYFPVSGRNQNSAAGWISQALTVAGETVNAVAMTVLPDAPTDPATGLRVPTIAVATGGGLSIIKDDQRVFSFSPPDFGSSAIDPIFIGDAIVWKAGGSSGQYLYRIVRNIRSISASASSANSFTVRRKDIFAYLGRLLGFGGRRDIITESHAFNGAGPYVLNRIAVNNFNTDRSIQTDITNIYNTGWMPGDIRRAYLSDTETDSVTGSELISNGTFDVDATGWSVLGPATVSGGTINVSTSTAEYWIIRQTIPTIVGRTYRVSLDIVSLTNNGGTAVVGVGWGVTNGVTQYTNAGTKTFTVTASGTSVVLCFYFLNATVSLDNISVREVVVDRSYKAANAVINGSLSRTALATGTSLVGYSGFSAANYLREPYSADLDFGTGEWSCSAWVNVPATLPTTSFPAIGSELITNGDFSSGATGWTAHASVTIGASAQFDGVTSLAPGVVLLTPSTPIVAVVGRFYRVTYTLTGNTLNGVSFYFGGVNGDVQNNAGTYTQIIRATGTDNFQIYTRAVTGVRAGGVDNISVVEVGPSAIFDRAFSSGPRIRCGLTSNGTLTAEAFDGTTTRTVTTSAAYNTASWLKAEACYTTDGTLSIRVNGREVATTRGNPLLSLNSRYNQILYSQELDNAAWTKGALTVSANTTATTDPLGGNTADKLQETTATAEHYIFQSVTVAAAQHTFSVYLKAAERTWATIYFSTGSATPTWFNLAADGSGGVGTVASGFTAASSYVGNGWYRCSITGTSTAATWYTIVNPSLGNNVPIGYAGTLGSGIYIWGADLRLASLSALPYQRVGAATDFDFQAPLTIGNNFAADAPFPGSIALLKLGATVPTYEQSQMMYEQEKQLFRAGAQSVLPDSGSIVDMAYDDATDRWVAISATNESYWTGLVRNAVTPVPAGSYTRVTAGSGVELVARSTTNPGVDVTLPGYGLREELVKRAEAAARLTKEIVVYDYVGGFTASTSNGSTAITSVANLTYPASYIGARISGSGIPTNTTIVAVSGTTIYLSAPATATATGVSISFLDFELPVGMETKAVLVAGTLKQEGSTKDYTRLYDGFIETVRFAVAPGATAWVQIQAQRITQ